MKLLLSKREASLPLYLSLACEELRVFGVFEKVSLHTVLLDVSESRLTV